MEKIIFGFYINKQIKNIRDIGFDIRYGFKYLMCLIEIVHPNYL